MSALPWGIEQSLKLFREKRTEQENEDKQQQQDATTSLQVTPLRFVV